MALDAGVNFIDTAEAYRTETIVGKAIAGRDRDDLVISTKKRLGGEQITAAALRSGLEGSLRRLRVDHVDVYHLHGLRAEQYDYFASEIVPEMMKLRDEGKLRFIGVTESWNRDLRHAMLRRALRDDCWDVFMVGFNLLNQTARGRSAAAGDGEKHRHIGDDGCAPGIEPAGKAARGAATVD